jgi:molecular chaperone DnaJ
MSSKRDYYEVLGAAREASSEELRKAYRREALKHHPDRNPGDALAEAKFKECTEAYQVLTDDEKRRIYDQFGHAGLEGGAGFDGIGDVFTHMQDLFAEMFSGSMGGAGGGARPRRGGDLRVQVRLTLREATFGCKREVAVRAPVTCTDCTGRSRARTAGGEVRSLTRADSSCSHPRARAAVARAVSSNIRARHARGRVQSSEHAR